MMVKLYRREVGRIEYFEAWDRNRVVTVHWGDVGDEGSSRVIQLRPHEEPTERIEIELKPARDQGFLEIPLEDHYQLVLQLNLETWGSEDDLSRCYELEDLLNESLGWTGIGHCDGHDFGSGTMNLFNFVVDPDAATEVILGMLEEEDFAEGAVIAYRPVQGDTYRVLWPEGLGAFEIL